jgi:predicted nucleic acid-binding protein
VRNVNDTNLLVSGFISSGVPRRLLDAARDDAFELCTSEVLLAELQLDATEWAALRSQFVTSNGRGGRRTAPCAFTE